MPMSTQFSDDLDENVLALLDDPKTDIEMFRVVIEFGPDSDLDEEEKQEFRNVISDAIAGGLDMHMNGFAAAFSNLLSSITPV